MGISMTCSTLRSKRMGLKSCNEIGPKREKHFHGELLERHFHGELGAEGSRTGLKK